MAAPVKRDPNEELAQSLGNIAKAIARASGDPIVEGMDNGQVIWLIANIIRLETERVKGKE